MSEPSWRLLVDDPAPGAWNMAVDEVLLEGVSAGERPTLRFYAWAPACLSLGYFQSFDVVDFDGCRALGVEIVRRPTGGRAILHDRELTYSLSLPASVLGLDAGILPSYHRISRALRTGMAALGVVTTMAPESAASSVGDHGPVCFDRPSAHEILLDGRKVVGSAQVRRGGAILQHGSIVIEPRIERLLACLRLGGRVVPSLKASVAGLSEVGVVSREPLMQAISAAISREFGIPLVPGRLSSQETYRARHLASRKYADAGWTQRPMLAGAPNTTRTR